jgi:hypothetical protein
MKIFTGTYLSLLATIITLVILKFCFSSVDNKTFLMVFTTSLVLIFINKNKRLEKLKAFSNLFYFMISSFITVLLFLMLKGIGVS